MSSIYDTALLEYFDVFDNDTLDKLVSLEESEKPTILSKLCDKLYKILIRKKFEKIDFREIEKTRGDITKFSQYNDMLECVNVLNDLSIQFKDKSGTISTIYTAINNLENNKDLFRRGFGINSAMVITTYCSLVYSAYASISLFIATSVEYLKTPTETQYNLILDSSEASKSGEWLLFKNLERFNNDCSNGNFKNSMEYIIGNTKYNRGLEESLSLGVLGALGGAGIVAVASNIIPLIRELIYYFFHCRVKISDYFEIQSNLLDANAYRVELDRTMSPELRKSIADKQHKIASKFAKIADFIRIQTKTADNKVAKDIKDENKKIKMEEIINDRDVNTLPDDAGDMESDSISKSLF